MPDQRPWPALDELPPDQITPAVYRYEQLARDDIDELAGGLARWHPDMTIGHGRHYSDPRFYEDRVALRGEAPRDIIVYVGRYEGRIIAALCLERNLDSETLFGRYGVCAPEHRSTGAALFAGYIMDALAVQMDLAMAYTLGTLKNPAMQRRFERMGFVPTGILPFSDRELSSDGVVRHVAEVLYVKTYRPPDAQQAVSPDALTDKVRALWEHLFSDPGRK